MLDISTTAHKRSQGTFVATAACRAVDLSTSCMDNPTDTGTISQLLQYRYPMKRRNRRTHLHKSLIAIASLYNVITHPPGLTGSMAQRPTDRSLVGKEVKARKASPFGDMMSSFVRVFFGVESAVAFFFCDNSQLSFYSLIS